MQCYVSHGIGSCVIQVAPFPLSCMPEQTTHQKHQLNSLIMETLYSIIRSHPLIQMAIDIIIIVLLHTYVVFCLVESLLSSMMVITVTTITNRAITKRNAITPNPASTPTSSEPPIGSEPSPPVVTKQLEVHVVVVSEDGSGGSKVSSGVGDDTVTDTTCIGGKILINY